MANRRGKRQPVSVPAEGSNDDHGTITHVLVRNDYGVPSHYIASDTDGKHVAVKDGVVTEIEHPTDYLNQQQPE